MEKMETILAVFLSFLLIFCQRLADGCSCADVHPQTHFCHAGFVIKATILKGEREPQPEGLWSSIPVWRSDYLYTVQVDQVFKGNGIKEGTNIVISTPGSGAACGNLNLQNGMQYVVSGSDYGGKFHHGLCGLSIKWWQVTPFQRQGFTNYYKQGCEDCEIRSGFRKPAAQQCSHDPIWYGTSNCELEHSACVQQSKGSCGWLQKPEYRRCRGSGFLEGSGFL